MKKFRKRLAIVAAAVLLLSVFTAGIASANSAVSRWQGEKTISSAYLTGPSPIIVEHEKLTFDIPQLSNIGDSKAVSFVTAEYTFYNPEDYAVSARLVFPFDENGYYCYYQESVDSLKNNITINGQVIERKLRYTYCNDVGFNVEKDLPRISDEYREDEFYRPDLPVQVFNYSITDIGGYNYLYIGFERNTKTTDYRMILDYDDSYVERHGWTDTIKAYIGKGENMTLYIMGEPLAEAPVPVFNSDYPIPKDVEGKYEVSEEPSITLEEMIRRIVQIKDPYMECDRYNYFVDAANDTSYRGALADIRRLSKYNKISWYQYDMEIDPRERIVNSVTAPLCPDVDGHKNPRVCTYKYLLSPASTWKSFGDLEVYVNSPLYIIDDAKTTIGTMSPLEEGKGYYLHLDSLPGTELEFSMSTSPDPSEAGPNFYGIGQMIFIFGPPILLAVALVAGIVFIIVFFSVRAARRRKK